MISNKKLTAVKDVRDLPAVKVDWVDSASTHGWEIPTTARKEHGLVRCQTVGYLLTRTRERVSVIQSVTEFGRVGETISIPSANIRKIKVLK